MEMNILCQKVMYLAWLAFACHQIYACLLIEIYSREQTHCLKVQMILILAKMFPTQFVDPARKEALQALYFLRTVSLFFFLWAWSWFLWGFYGHHNPLVVTALWTWHKKFLSLLLPSIFLLNCKTLNVQLHFTCPFCAKKGPQQRPFIHLKVTKMHLIPYGGSALHLIFYPVTIIAVLVPTVCPHEGGDILIPIVTQQVKLLPQ